MDKIERFARLLRDIGLIIGLPIIIVTGFRLYDAQIKALELENKALSQTQYQNAFSIISAQNKLHQSELMRIIESMKAINLGRGVESPFESAKNNFNGVQDIDLIKNPVFVKEYTDNLINMLDKFDVDSVLAEKSCTNNSSSDSSNPEFLVRTLYSLESEGESACIINRLKKLNEQAASNPSVLPAKYLEVAGDWCRKNNQSHQALEFYRASMERDPGRVSAKVEFYALQAEVLPKARNNAIQILTDLALSGKLKINTIKRIFNTFMELNEFKKLASLTDALVKLERYRDNPSSLATFYRNNAVALKEDVGYITEEAWNSIKKAVAKNHNDENVIKIYANWLLEKNEFDEAIIQAKVLLKMDSTDISYYLLLGDAFIANENYNSANKVFKYALTIADGKSDKIRLIVGHC